jgi:hypothetical protein
MKGIYESLPAHVDEVKDDIELTGIPSTSDESFEDEYERRNQLRVPSAALINIWNRWEEPILPSSLISFLLLPILLFLIGFSIHFTGRLWAAWAFVLHLHLRIGVSQFYFNSNTEVCEYQRQRWLRILCSFAAFMDIILCAVAYPMAVYLLTEAFFLDIDGTINIDWKRQVILLRAMIGLGLIVAVLRLGVCAFTFFIKTKKRRVPSSQEWNPTFWIPSNSESLSNDIRRKLSKAFMFANILISVLNVLCILSVLSHFGPWPQVPLIPEACDPLDTTLCALPFPSFFHMKEDKSTGTGWRVDLKGLPPLRGGIPLYPKFLNSLDGFSTAAPILFYMDGLKEAHEGPTILSPSLQGPANIEKSTTELSITLLVNVDDHTLVPHSAEIDYLDPTLPLVIVIPAQPLRHMTHFAVVVFNASDVNGNRLPRSKGLESVLDAYGSQRYKRLVDIVIPALRDAAPWTNFTDDPESVQLLFDFVTMSGQCQIGHTRAIRDFGLNHVDKWDWQEHVEMVRETKHDCNNENSLIARTYHINLDVPSFLKERSRYSTLDSMVFVSGEPVSVEKAKVMIRVPCSVEKAALGHANGKPVKVVMEYGHGLFQNRGEVEDGFLSKMANENGYLLMAMDWRGMSTFDLPVVIKTLIGNPGLFQAVRDNLIQGYSEKLALQHFSRNGMFDWLKIDGVVIPTEKNDQPASVFYG